MGSATERIRPPPSHRWVISYLSPIHGQTTIRLSAESRQQALDKWLHSTDEEAVDLDQVTVEEDFTN